MAQHKGASADTGGATAGSSRVHVALTDRQWDALAPLVPGADGASRGRIAAPQSVVEGILYAIRNGLGMQSVPPPYPSGSTLYRRFSAWTANGQWEAIWGAFLNTLSPNERRQWEAAARQRPGVAADAAPVAQAAEAVAQQPPVDLPRVSPTVAAAPATAPRLSATPVEPIEDPAQAFEPGSERVAPISTPLSDPAGPPAQQSPEAASQRIGERLELSAAESEIVRRRIGDHGVAAALVALDEVERRMATGTMRGVGGMPMSAFEIWVCAVGLARRPVERPRAPRTERSDRHEVDRDRRKRQWRKSP